MTEEPKQYEISTLRDVWDKVPYDRIEDCMNELGVLLAKSKAMQGIIHFCVEHTSGEALPEKIYELPETIIWVDDGKGHLETRFPDMLTMTIKKEQNDDQANDN